MEMKTEKLPVIPLAHGVVLPHMNATIPVESEEARAALAAAREEDLRVLLVPKIEGRYATVGTVAKIEDTGQMPDGTPAAVVQGRYRALVGTVTADAGGALFAEVEPRPDPTTFDEETRQLAREYRAVVENILELRGVPQIAQVLRAIENAGHLADMSGYSPDFSLERKVEILETLDVKGRLTKIISWNRDTLADLSLKDELRSQVGERMEKQQREFLLRQQMEAIKKQLGETGDTGSEYRRKLEEAKMPELVRKEVERELDRLDRTSEQSPEYGWIRNYLDWMFEIPWEVRSPDNFDLVEARRILDEDHYGLDDVKDRILEFLAVRKRRNERGSSPVGGRGSGAIITLVGPPGVGKTSLGESVARALGRKFARVSLGGIHDEAEIRGHRRTYIGALPGRIVRALKEAGTKRSEE